jgi:hypothetical protein
MQFLRRFTLLCVALSSAAFAHADNFHGVSFSCSAVPQANLNDVTTASEVRTTAKNVSSETLVVRYHVVVTSSQGRVEDYDYTRAGFHGNFVPGSVEAHKSTPFSKASVQDEFPKTCRFTQIQVCPAKPPVGFQGTYFRPFIDGDKECKAVGNITIALATPKSSGGCTAITKTWAMTPPYGHHYVYGIGADAHNIDAAVTKASVSSNDEEQTSVVMVKDCGPAHGAVAASLKLSCYNNGCQVLADGIYEEMAAALAGTKESAEQQALTGCHQTDTYKRVPANDHCQIIKSW